MSTSVCIHCSTPNRAGAKFCIRCGAQFTSPARLQPSQVMHSKYTIVRELGRGGMGAVYLATETIANQQRQVVIKEMLDYYDPSDPQAEAKARQRFEAEAATLVTLNFASIPQIFDYFSEGARNYIVMQYIQGCNLESGLTHEENGSLIPGQPYPVEKVRQWGIQVCKVLENLAAQNVVHMDIKPANLILDNSDNVWLVDFGTARAQWVVQPSGQLGLKKSSIYGTAGYAPPEQYQGRAEPRSDVYALAATLYHLLSDDDPRDHPLSFSKIGQLPTDLASALKSALEQDVRRRVTAMQFRQQLEARTPPASSILPPWVAVALVGIVLLLGLGAAIIYRIMADSPQRPSPSLSTAVAVATTPPAILTTRASSASALPTQTPTNRTIAAPTTMPVPPTATPTQFVSRSAGLVAYEAGPEGAWQIFIADPASGKTWTLPGQLRNSGVPAWSPDGDRLTFRSDQGGNWQIYVTNLDGTGLQQLTSGGSNNMEAAWSPDGTQIAFVSERDGNKEIYVMDSNGKNQRRLTYNSDVDDDPSWSPDGQWLVVESVRGGRMDVYKMRADGSNQIRLTSGGDLNSTPAWSPDGKWIAFEHKVGQVYHIWIMNADGGQQRQLTFDGISNQRPAWSPDGSEIAYAHIPAHGQVEAVWITGVDGSSPPRRLSPSEGFDPAWSRR